MRKCHGRCLVLCSLLLCMLLCRVLLSGVLLGCMLSRRMLRRHLRLLCRVLGRRLGLRLGLCLLLSCMHLGLASVVELVLELRDALHRDLGVVMHLVLHVAHLVCAAEVEHEGVRRRLTGGRVYGKE